MLSHVFTMLSMPLEKSRCFHFHQWW